MTNGTLKISTTARQDMTDITSLIAREVEKSGVDDGICILFVPHTTCGIVLSENADPDVKGDILRTLSALIPIDNPAYRHGEGNSAAHIKSILTGNSITIPVRNRALTLGTWQGVFFCEYDGPRERSVNIRIQ